MADVRRGDIVIVNLEPKIGVEIKKTRPAIVVSNDSINRFSQLVVVVAFDEKYRPPFSQSRGYFERHGSSYLCFESRDLSKSKRSINSAL